jgi:predicted amidohydrolase
LEFIHWRKKNEKCKKTTSTILVLSIVLLPSLASANSDQGSVESKIALIHFKPELGNVNSNLQTLKALISQALDNGANIVVTPEFATTGYCITRQQALNELGFTYPYPQLNEIRDLAIEHKAYVVVAIVENAADSKVYNTVVVFGPQGLLETQEKRTIPLWHDSGNIPFEVVSTPYGDLGTLICGFY